jgi:hypothetical protein
MATLKQAEGRTFTPGGDCLIGRSRRADLKLDRREVSHNHAQLRWTGERWELWDLGSRNGTFLDGRRLEPAERVALARGSSLSFGALEPCWSVVEDGPPIAAARSVDDERWIRAEGGLLTLAADPPVSVYHSAEGDWVLERSGGSEPVENLQVVDVGGTRWRLHLPEGVVGTWEASRPIVGLLRLRFQVSRDEEFVALSGGWSGGALDLGAKAHNYLLLTLARARLEDREAGCAPSEEGWRDVETLLQMLRFEESRLNVDIFRARKAAGEAGVEDAANIVERRRYKRLLRLGTASFTIGATE